MSARLENPPSPSDLNGDFTSPLQPLGEGVYTGKEDCSGSGDECLAQALLRKGEYQVVIEVRAKDADERRHVMDRAVDIAAQTLKAGQMRSRPPFSPRSFAAHSACDLITGHEIVANAHVPLGTSTQEPSREFNDWACYWSQPNIDVTIGYNTKTLDAYQNLRSTGTQEALVGKNKQYHMFLNYYMASDNSYRCHANIQGKPSPLVPSGERRYFENLEILVNSSTTTSQPELCGYVRNIAGIAAGRLP